MLHPVYAALLQRPDLLLEHGLAYAQLLQAHAHSTGKALRTRALAAAAALLGATLALLLAGIGLMLGLLLDRYHPVLWCLPGACALLALLAALLARRPMPSQAWQQLQTELEDDLRMLRSLG